MNEIKTITEKIKQFRDERDWKQLTSQSRNLNRNKSFPSLKISNL